MAESGWRRLTATFAVAAAVAFGAWGAAATQGCSLKNCDGDFVNVDKILQPNGGVLPDFPNAHFLDEPTRRVWESTPILSDWYPLPDQRTVGIVAPVPPPIEVTVYLSVDPSPVYNPDGSLAYRDYAQAAGNIAEVRLFPGSGYFQVHNDSCATYYMRAVVRSYAPPFDAGAISPDAGADAGPDADASAIDLDASADADAAFVDSALDATESGPIDAGTQ